MRDDLLGDLESHLLESLDATSTSDDVSRITAELGSPESFSAELGGDAGSKGTAGARTLLGVPYEMRIPTAERVAARLWSPTDPRILMPRIFGIGWDINFGAIAVKLHLIEPDSEDIPFTSTPKGTFVAALAVPVGLTLAILISYLALRGSLPAQLPSHWNMQGVADGFWDQSAAFGFLFLMALIPTLWAVWSVARLRPPMLRGAVIGFASLFAALAAFIWVLTLVSLTGFAAWWTSPLLVFVALAAPFGIFLWLARAGRHAEQQRDFANNPSSQEGRKL
jgi:hypothetical protein